MGLRLGSQTFKIFTQINKFIKTLLGSLLTAKKLKI